MHSVKAIVVGTGFGGAVTACRLSQAGYAPLVLERGRRYEANDFPALPNASSLLPDLRRWTWTNEQGLWDIVDLGEIISAQAAGYGGGSLIYANVHLRPSPSVFDERWPGVYRTGDVLGPYYDLVASMLDVAPITRSGTRQGRLADGIPVKARQLQQVARSDGREGAFFYPPLAVNYDGKNKYGKTQGKCISCGACSSGCAYGAKNTLDFNYLAGRGGAVVRKCERSAKSWISIRVANTGKWNTSITLRPKRWRSKPSSYSCARGHLHSTRLLARIHWKSRSAGHKLSVGLGYYPNADAMGVVYDTDHPQNPSWGPTITTATVHESK